MYCFQYKILGSDNMMTVYFKDIKDGKATRELLSNLHYVVYISDLKYAL